jgi:GNAT superfamily N-acetyltransferase
MTKRAQQEVAIRPATKADLGKLGQLGAKLLRAHYGFDRDRFMAPLPGVEEGYAWFLGTQLEKRGVVVLVAERRGRVVGYAYAGIEPRSWKELRERCGFIHDVVVDESARRAGIATRLLESAADWLAAKGAPRVVLWTAEKNPVAQKLFARLGFRRTMIEMTRES